MSTNEEDYIDMELTTSSPSKNIEFEFQMSFTCKNDPKQENNTSPADELFYKGKLLPLHLRPRRQIIESLAASEITKLPLQESHNYYYYHHHHHHSMPLIDSRNISPSESCRVSCDQDYYNFFEFSTDLSRLPMKKPKRLKLAQKLKENLSKVEALLSKYLKISKKGSFGHISRSSCPKIANFVEDNVHRKSFSDKFKRHSPTKCLSSSSSDSSSGASSSSSSFSLRSNGQHELSFLRRSSSANEIEASINAAIDHCKKSLQIFHAINLGEDEKNARSNL
ncbi:probable membrane-associated kinase regulator 4 [Phtheirospermum japonicum]|uniref:Probable membrane-associated kinase regulator 4 n=1 Tax=Phtheirospermum japonicum TaxID=374723 RepID=A0A830CPK5_9LAMI|nr:probable membrane-associated kinase regulator 4 [Phtheirospermum japonicum]